MTDYKIKFALGIGTNYEYIDLDSGEYSKIKNSLEYQHFLAKMEEAYEKIVYNYRDYEQYNFSIVLNHVLDTDTSDLPTISNSIDRHISNILASTYIYICLLKIAETNKGKEIKDKVEYIYTLKKKFKKIVNDYHANYYQYTFVAALRNKLNHAGNLQKLVTLGSTWSLYNVNSEYDKNLMITKKDKLFSLFDVKVEKKEAKIIIDNDEHYRAVEASIPENFYLRNSIKMYINLLSNAHAKVREIRAITLKDSNDLISKCLSKNKDSKRACIIKYVNGEEKETMNLFSYIETIKKSKAPILLDRYTMPGEFEVRSIINKI